MNGGPGAGHGDQAYVDDIMSACLCLIPGPLPNNGPPQLLCFARPLVCELKCIHICGRGQSIGRHFDRANTERRCSRLLDYAHSRTHSITQSRTRSLTHEISQLLTDSLIIHSFTASRSQLLNIWPLAPSPSHSHTLVPYTVNYLGGLPLLHRVGHRVDGYALHPHCLL